MKRLTEGVRLQHLGDGETLVAVARYPEPDSGTESEG